jgi:hypothetical protein
MANAWISHVKKTMGAMKKAGSYKKGDGLKKVILAAKKTYKSTRRASKKGRRGGADEGMGGAPTPAMQSGNETPAPVASGGRRRRSTRRRARR